MSSPTPSGSLVVLAGGASRRMGDRHKAFLRVGGREVLERLLAGGAAGFRDVVLVVGDPAPYRQALERYRLRQVRVVGDRRPGLGPLAGFEAGLVAAREPRAWVVACDLPFLEPGVGRALLAALSGRRGSGPGEARRLDARGLPPRAAVPVIEGRLQPLCAAYERRVGAEAAICLDLGIRSAHALLERLEVVRLDETAFHPFGDPTRLFFNLNDRTDLRRARRLARMS